MAGTKSPGRLAIERLLADRPRSLDDLEEALKGVVTRRRIVELIKETRLIVRVDRTCIRGPYAFPVYGLATRKVIRNPLPKCLTRGQQGRIIFLKRTGLSGSEVGRIVRKSRSAVLGVIYRHNHIHYSDQPVRERCAGEAPLRSYWDETKLTETWAHRKARLAKEKAARAA